MRDLHKEQVGVARPVVIVDRYWNFFSKPGSSLVGQVKGYVYDKETRERNFLVVQQEKGKKLILVSLFRSRLREQLDRKGVMVGDRIEIKYLGEEPKSRDWRFRVTVDPRSEAVDVRKGRAR